VGDVTGDRDPLPRRLHRHPIVRRTLESKDADRGKRKSAIIDAHHTINTPIVTEKG